MPAPYPASKKQEAIKLRKTGKSLNEISRKLEIAKSTASLWLSGVKINRFGKERLAIRAKSGLINAKITLHRNNPRRHEDISKHVESILKTTSVNKEYGKVLCSLLYWAEGGKRLNHVHFVNSDPKMLAVFIKLLRQNFELDEKKFRVRLHLHDYHDDLEMQQFWSDKVGIPLNSFSMSYRKPHTAIRKKPGYPGCADLRYYDWKIAYELYSIYNSLANFIVGAW